MRTHKPRAIIPWVPGTNCHLETQRALELAGARPEVLPLKLCLLGRRRLDEADLIIWPGGFGHGDHFGTGRVQAIDLRLRLSDQLSRVLERRIPMLGICNGFQVLTAAGLIGAGPAREPTVALDFNQSANFEHWYNVTVYLHEPKVRCIWTKGLEGVPIVIPTAHGEGRPVGDLDRLHITGTYGTEEGTKEYPASPNGSHIAAACDATGLIMGIMPHPDRRVDKLRGGDDGLAIFRNGVDAVR